MTQRRSLLRSVAIVDDDPIDRETLRRALLQIDDTIQVSECASCAEARLHLRHAQPDLIILDQRLGDGQGVDLAREIGDWPNLRGAALMMLSGENCLVLADMAAHSPCQMLVSKEELTTALLAGLILGAEDADHVSDIPATPESGSAGTRDIPEATPRNAA